MQVEVPLRKRNILYSRLLLRIEELNAISLTESNSRQWRQQCL